MKNNIIKQIKELPNSPGIYKFISDNGDILYIGKARNLQQRVIYYTKPDLIIRLQKMVSLASKIEHITTKSESEALLLEARLIKQHQPKFNILLKDDKSFPYIIFKNDHEFPYIFKKRSKKAPEGKYFGPFASNNDVEATLSELQKIFKLRSCSDNYFASRKRPCLQYQIKRCTGPCVGKINKSDYLDLVEEVENFLSGKTKQLQEHLSEKMESLSNNMEYEKAAEIRDKIKALSYIQMKFGSYNDIINNTDVILLISKSDISAVLVAIYRNGQYYGNHIYFLDSTENNSHSEILYSFIEQFYQDKESPDEILLKENIDNEKDITQFLEHYSGKKVKLSFANRGAKLDLVKSFDDIIEKALLSKLKDTIKKSEIFYQLQDLFELESLPEIIEVYDNSHIMGKHAVGGMIVANKDGFLKNKYRYYNLESNSSTGGNDYQMLSDVLTKRLEKIIKDPNSKPSIMIIDGGKGHMSVVESVMKKLSCFVPFVCMSKGPDRNAGCEYFHMPLKEAFTLDKNNEVMKYLQILRDEAHNFAITSHRKKRSRAIRNSILDNVDGIGAKRKKDLLHTFGSIEAIKNASEKEIESINSIGKSMARKIFLALHNDVL